MKKSESVQAQKRTLAQSGAVPVRAEKAWIDHTPDQVGIDKKGRPKSRVSDWERGRRDAIACGGGRYNFVNEPE